MEGKRILDRKMKTAYEDKNRTNTERACRGSSSSSASLFGSFFGILNPRSFHISRLVEILEKNTQNF